MKVRCHHCGAEQFLQVEDWRCTCGGAWEPAVLPVFDPGKIVIQDASLWRYGAFLGIDLTSPSKRLGVGWTPLVPVIFGDRHIYLKLSFLSLSGSFKDRGVNVMVNQLAAMGVHTVVEDSSGNAGASLAAHAARFGLNARIFVPAYTSAAKQNQIRVYGAAVIPVSGPRSAATEAAEGAVDHQSAYASHAYHPAYLAGQMTAAWELWEQLDHQGPDWVVLPAAQGGLYLGLWFGFKRLLSAGLIRALPRLVLVQADQIAPIVGAWESGLTHVPARTAKGPTLAEGVAISHPVRGKRLLQALRESRGMAIRASEKAILDAQRSLAHQGFYVEPTSALALVGLNAIADELEVQDRVVLCLTGSGLKGQPAYSSED